MTKNLFLFQKIFDNYIDPLVLFDQKGNIEYGNKHWRDFSGYQPKELVGEPLIALVPPKTKNKINDFLKRKLDVMEKINTFCLTKKNKEIPVILNILPLKNEKNKFVGGLAVFSAEKEKIEKDLKENSIVLEIRIKAKTRALRELNETLEDQVEIRTKELQEQIDELEKWRKLAVGRELKMADLKEEIGKLKLKIRDGS